MMNGVSPKHFLAGGMCREEATSAFLATLIEHSTDFRKRFFKLCDIPDFKIMDVVVEQAHRDITITGNDTFVIIENKIANASKTKGQLLSYYSQLKAEFPQSSIHAVYLAPTRNTGQSEVEVVKRDEGANAIAIAWSDIKPLCENLDDFDPTFSQTGIMYVLEAIRRRSIVAAPDWDENQLRVRECMSCIVENIKPEFPNRRLVAFGCQIWAYGPVTVVLTCTPTVAGTQVIISCDPRFRLAGRDEDRKYAKSWLNSIKTDNKWGIYKPDDRQNWRVSEETRDCTFDNLEETAMSIFRELVNAIDEGIAQEKCGFQ